MCGLHYVVKELENAMDLSKIEIINFVAVENKLIEIPIEIIGISKNLAKLKELVKELPEMVKIIEEN